MPRRRLHFLLDDSRYQKLAREAERRGVPVAALIREAIDRLLVESERRRAAVAAILAASPMPVPADPADVRREPEATQNRVAE